MSIVALDTSVVVAALLDWHEHHAAALPVLQAALATPASLVLPLPALLESYAVMTRLPAPWRLRATDAHRLLHGTFRRAARLVSLRPGEAWIMLDELAEATVAGGATHDAHIAACARMAGADQLATFNRRHFERLDLGEMTLLVPVP